MYTVKSLHNYRGIRKWRFDTEEDAREKYRQEGGSVERSGSLGSVSLKNGRKLMEEWITTGKVEYSPKHFVEKYKFIYADGHFTSTINSWEIIDGKVSNFKSDYRYTFPDGTYIDKGKIEEMSNAESKER